MVWSPFRLMEKTSKPRTLVRGESGTAASLPRTKVRGLAERQNGWKWAVPLVIAAVLALLAIVPGREVIGQVSRLYELAEGPNAYFHASHAALLYLVTPVIVVGSFTLFLLPGAVLTITLNQARRVETLLLMAFTCSLALTIALSTTAKLLMEPPLNASVMIGMWTGVMVAASGLLAYRLRQGAVIAWPLTSRTDMRRLLSMAGAVVAGVALLIPKVFWEDFNLDGIEAFEFGRSLTYHIMPRWEISGGVFGFYQNFWLFAYPNHWFITLFGPVEAAARLPYFLYLALMFAAMVLLIEQGSRRQMSGVEESALGLGLALYTVVQVYSTNYEPFFADMAETAATDTLGIFTFLAACYFLWEGRTKWFTAFALLTYFATPGSLLLIGLLAGFTFLSKSPRRWEQMRALVGVIAVAVLIGLAYEYIYSPLALDGIKSQFSAINLVRRLVPPTLTEFVRFNALVFTTGILPAVSLFLVRRGDWRGWTLAFVTLVYFLVLYAQVWTSLHQFTPIMVMPLIVFWRLYLNSDFSLFERAIKPRTSVRGEQLSIPRTKVRGLIGPSIKKWLVPGIAVTTIVSLYLSLPQHFQISTATRELGYATDYRIGDYQRDYEAASEKVSESLWSLIDSSYRLQYPNQPWGTDEYSWLYYAAQDKPEGTIINYIAQSSTEVPPSGFTEVMNDDGVAVYVRDVAPWEQDRERNMPRMVGSTLYEPILGSTYQFFRDYMEELAAKSAENAEIKRD